MRKLLFLFLLGITFFGYVKTGNQIENRSEAEDAFEYALIISEGEQHPRFFHKHHLLYGQFICMAHACFSKIGLELSIMEVMRIMSAASSTGTLFFFALFCYRRYHLSPLSTFFATLFLGSCYGFWRYAAEAEIPLIASFLGITSFYYSSELNNKKRFFLVGVISSICAVSIHVMNLVVVFLAIPVFYLTTRQYKKIFIHTGTSAFAVFLLYYFIQIKHSLYPQSNELSLYVGYESYVKAWVALLQCIISCDFVLGLSSARDFLMQLFPNRMFLEEFFYGERLPSKHIIISVFTFLFFIIFTSASIIFSIKTWHGRLLLKNSAYLGSVKPSVISASIYFISYVILLLLIEPGNPELWVMGLIPFALLIGCLVLYPLMLDNKLWVPFMALIILSIHNGSAIRLLSNGALDYQKMKAQPVLALADEGDLVISASNPVFERYLRYHSSGDIIYLFHEKSHELTLNDLHKIKGEVYFLGDVFDVPSSLKVRFPEKVLMIEKFAKKMSSEVVQVVDDSFGGIYTLKEEHQ